jgi:hypothetical protein
MTAGSPGERLANSGESGCLSRLRSLRTKLPSIIWPTVHRGVDGRLGSMGQSGTESPALVAPCPPSPTVADHFGDVDEQGALQHPVANDRVGVCLVSFSSASIRSA